MRVVLAKTRHHYDSYVDFWRLADAAGLPTCFVDEIDLTRADTTYVFTPHNGELPPVIERSKAGRRARLVWWNLERPADETLPATLDQLDGALDAIWVSDRTFAKVDPRFTYVPIAGHPHIAGYRHGRPLRYDVCPLSYLWGRRQAIIHQLDKRGVRIAPMAFGRAEQDMTLPCSGLVLNLHQYEATRTIAPLRFAVAASYAVPIISEAFDDPAATALVIAAVPYESIVPTVLMWCRPDRASELVDHGLALHQRLCLDTHFGLEVARAAGELCR